MDEDADGEITQEEFIKVSETDQSENADNYFVKACLSQKKFATMLTLKIINIIIAE